MIWKIEFDKDVEKDLRKLDKQGQKKIFQYLRKVRSIENPKAFAKPLKGHLKNLWRFRVNNVRIVCRIDLDTNTMLILRIAHRSKVYKHTKYVLT